MKEKLNKILQELSKINGNITYTDTLSKGLGINKTDLGNEYIEYLNKSRIEKIILHINNLSGFYTVITAGLALIISVLSLIISISN